MNKMRKIIMRATLAALAIGIAGSASAAVTYTFTAFSSQGGRPFGKFVYTAPTFFTVGSGGAIALSALTSCSVTSPATGATCANQNYNNSAGFNAISFGYNDSNGFGLTSYIFNPGTLSSLGNFGSQGGPMSGQFAGLSITTDAIPTVPEPASWALMIAGFGLVGAGMRRRAAVRVAYS